MIKQAVLESVANAMPAILAQLQRLDAARREA